MARMFCTLKQAAAKLQTTEAQIETLVNDGTLREFRDGSNRLLKVADLPAAADAARSATHRRQATRGERRAESASCEHDTASAAEIRLPRAAVVEAPAPGTRTRSTLRPAQSTRGKPARHSEYEPPGASWHTDPIAAALSPTSMQRPRRQPREAAARRDVGRTPRKPAATRRNRKPSRAAAAGTSARGRQRAQTHELPLRQWLWMGLLDDEPFAILLLFATVLLGLASVAGAIYLLARAL